MEKESCEIGIFVALQDDSRDRDLTFEDIVPVDTTVHISYDQLVILLETIESEMKKLKEAAVQIEKCSSPTSMPSLQPLKVIQSVKCVIKLMGNLCTLDLSMAVEELQRVCKLFLSFREVSAYCGEGRSLRVDFQKSSLSETIANICNQIREATRNLIEMYSQTFNVDFEMKRPLEGPAPVKNVPEISDMLVIRMCAIYRPHVDWKHDSFMVAAQIYHGTRPVGHPALSTPCVKTEMDHLWPARIIFNNCKWNVGFQAQEQLRTVLLTEWKAAIICGLSNSRSHKTCTFPMEVPINSLARESRLMLVIYGRTLDSSEGSDGQSDPKYKQEEIGWAAVQFFNYEGVMVQGNVILSIWPPETQFLHGAPPPFGTQPILDHPMMDIQISGLPKAEFPKVPPDLSS
ncbi:hypothetical protein GEV33_004544 [Tenebrio molitor]|uniref:C2 PI3K-type domain-containing protein n=1 Tax=Tenebrio molitor TaxID=7067 RepID=A0A8J6HPY1_TENMO|nr:hypothetical protein GEV33_004544 [Tenebrio molitor]